MVGRRNRSFFPGGKEEQPGKHSNSPDGYRNGDLESGQARPRPNLSRFKDAAGTALNDKRRQDLKEALLNGVNQGDLEKFRKSDEEVGYKRIGAKGHD